MTCMLDNRTPMAYSQTYFKKSHGRKSGGKNSLKRRKATISVLKIRRFILGHQNFQHLKCDGKG